jgi:formiminotetrahydrofolate cyclodeaminase
LTTIGLLNGPTELLELRVQELLDGLGELEPGPRSGSAAALAAGMAASVVAMCARAAEKWDEARGALAQAELLRVRVTIQAYEDAAAYAAARAGLDEVRAAAHAAPGSPPLSRALARAAEVPLAIAATSRDVAELAEYVAERCDPDSRPDAAAAAALAAGAARAAAHLVAVNLGATAGDERVLQAEDAARGADAAAGRALAAV